MTALNRTDKVRNIIKNNITIVQNGQDNLAIQQILRQGVIMSPTVAMREYFKNRDFVIAQHKREMNILAGEVSLNVNGSERKSVEQRGGKITFANVVRRVINRGLDADNSLLEICEKLHTLTTLRYKRLGKDVDKYGNPRKPAYFRLVARNEMERVLPAIQKERGMTVNTPAEIKIATRKRQWKKRSL